MPSLAAKRETLLLGGLCLVWYCGCAEPRVPTGGPRDITPPALVFSEPANEAVNVTEQTIRLEFSEYVNQASFQRALSITPEPEVPPRLRWRKRRVDILFEHPLQDSTTYVIALDNNLRDMRSVPLKKPITVAFSTGDIIDQGLLHGRAVESKLGAPVGGFDVLAYRTYRDSVSAMPSYRTQTGDDGSFTLSYLREGAYFVVVVQDRNRDRRAGPNEPFATPPVPALDTTADTLGLHPEWVISLMDTLAPRIDRVRSLSDRRVQVRFSEAMAYARPDAQAWMLSDSLEGHDIEIRSVYMRPSDTRSIYLVTAPLQETVYRLVPDPSLTDSSANELVPDVFHFVGATREDTTTLRFIGFWPPDSALATRLVPHEQPRVIFSEALGDIPLSEVMKAHTTSGTPREVHGESRDNTTYTIRFVPPLTADDTVVVSVQTTSQGKVVYEQLFARRSPQEMGSLSGNVVPPHSQLMVELLTPSRQTVMATAADSVGAFTFGPLPEDSYHIRAYVDRNRNSRWDGGQINPYEAPEPITWVEAPQTVRARWDTALADTLRLPSR